MQSFYSEVFGWAVAPRGPGYAAIGTPPGSADGALVEAQTATVTIGIVVPHLARSLEIVLERGGAIAMQPTDNGWVVNAQITDPAGNQLTLIQGSACSG